MIPLLSVTLCASACAHDDTAALTDLPIEHETEFGGAWLRISIDEFLEKGMKVRLEKEPDNPHDHEAIKVLMGHRVNVVFEQEGIDTRAPGITFQLNLAASIAQSESESISENQKWVYKKLAEQGVFRANPGRYFGYNTDDRNFHPDKNAKYVRGVFKHYLRGETFTEIVRKFLKKR